MSDDHHIPTAKHELNPEPSERLARPFQRFASLSSSGGIVLLLMTGIAMVWANINFESYDEIFNETEIRITVAHNPHHAPTAGEYKDDNEQGAADEYSNATDPAENPAYDTKSDEIEQNLDETVGEASEQEYGAAKADYNAWHPLPNTPHWWQGHSIAAWINDLLMAIFFLVVGLEIKREILVGELASPKQAALPIFGAIGGIIGPALIFVAFNMGKRPSTDGACPWRPISPLRSASWRCSDHESPTRSRSS
ncbi:MAG: Na+/H+ antiporter NhaA [Phycisphaerales bacterium]|nr:Na+/H+ antiporter NhaA [Phycisphaerales bacterium]